MDNFNPHMILFIFALMSRYINQTSEKKSHFSSIMHQTQNWVVLPLSTIMLTTYHDKHNTTTTKSEILVQESV